MRIDRKDRPLNPAISALEAPVETVTDRSDELRSGF